MQAAATDASGAVRVTVADIEGALQNPALLYDRAGDQHYWLISAFIKSVRGTDPGRRGVLARADARSG